MLPHILIHVNISIIGSLLSSPLLVLEMAFQPKLDGQRDRRQEQIRATRTGFIELHLVPL